MLVTVWLFPLSIDYLCQTALLNQLEQGGDSGPEGTSEVNTDASKDTSRIARQQPENGDKMRLDGEECLRFLIQ
jgi:hypothetical protein